jgi:hypothetical protein
MGAENGIGNSTVSHPLPATYRRATKRTATTLSAVRLRSNPRERPRTHANSLPQASAFSRLFARVRCCSWFLRKSGRRVQVGFPMRFWGDLRSCCGPNHDSSRLVIRLLALDGRLGSSCCLRERGANRCHMSCVVHLARGKDDDLLAGRASSGGQAGSEGAWHQRG